MEAYLAMGMTFYSLNIKEGQTIYGDKEGQQILLPSYKVEKISRISDQDLFLEKLEAHQKGQTDFPHFCQDVAAAGIYKWEVNLLAKTCQYFNLEDQLLYSQAISL